MDGLPEPPAWPRESVTVDDDVADALTDIRTTAFFDGRRDAEEQAAEDFVIVGRGTGRIVVAGNGLPSDAVAKVAISQRGYEANQKEAFEREQNPDLAPYLPPVLARDSTSNWAVYERCDVPGDSDAIQALETVLETLGLEYECRELAAPNVGYYDGRPCIVDWAELL